MRCSLKAGKVRLLFVALPYYDLEKGFTERNTFLKVGLKADRKYFLLTDDLLVPMFLVNFSLTSLYSSLFCS